MSNLYRITPLEKKSVEYFVDVFERLPDGTIRGFDVTEYWRWGQGWKEEDDPVWKSEMKQVYCDSQTGWGCELDDLCGVYVNFSDGFTDKEKEEITNSGIIISRKGAWKTTPMFADKVINIDTGAAFNGKLTIMNAETLEYWQSDTVQELYPNEKGRN